MAKISYNLIEQFISDKSYDQISSNNNQLEIIKKTLKLVIVSELTIRQREILILYFYKKLKMTEIATILKINKSTVSRTLKRAIQKIHKHIKYCSLR